MAVPSRRGIAIEDATAPSMTRKAAISLQRYVSPYRMSRTMTRGDGEPCTAASRPPHAPARAPEGAIGGPETPVRLPWNGLGLFASAKLYYPLSLDFSALQLNTNGRQRRGRLSP